MRASGNYADHLIRVMAGSVFGTEFLQQRKAYMPITKENIEDVFTYHPPTGDQPARYEQLREAGKELSYAILECVPVCADQQAALRHVREAVMTANGAIALKGKI